VRRGHRARNGATGDLRDAPASRLAPRQRRVALPHLRRSERLGVIAIIVTAIGNIGRWLVQLADWLDERYVSAPKTLVEQLETAGWSKRKDVGA
jgi:hypothetical protein